MLGEFTANATRIILATGATDFRKQSQSLSTLVSAKLQLDPFEGESVFIFCNKRRNALKVLRYDSNGFILASKKLLDGMKFQWPSTPEDVKFITRQQLTWLLDGLEIEQRKAHREVKMDGKTTCY